MLNFNVVEISNDPYEHFCIQGKSGQNRQSFATDVMPTIMGHMLLGASWVVRHTGGAWLPKGKRAALLGTLCLDSAGTWKTLNGS